MNPAPPSPGYGFALLLSMVTIVFVAIIITAGDMTRPDSLGSRVRCLELRVRTIEAAMPAEDAR